MFRPSTAFALALALAAPLAAQAQISSSVSYDAATSLYTYSYVVDGSKIPAAAGVLELGVLVEDGQNFDFKKPIAPTVPSGFFMSILATDPPNAETYYGGWGAATSGSDLTFSFATTTAPDTSTRNNYFLWADDGSATTPPPYAVGRVIGPEIQPALPAVPEPSEAAMLAFGGALVALVARRRKAGRA